MRAVVLHQHVFFFFQAEDGIRDGHVTGVQTCALPILTAHHFADGDPTHLHPTDLPPVDGIALCAAHLGRSRLLRDWIDPSVTDEHDPLSVDPELDMYDPRHRVPYDADFLARFSAAQKARLDRIERWAIERLALLRAT